MIAKKDIKTVPGENKQGTVKTQYYTFAKQADSITLDSGKSFGPITVAYETYGKINPRKDNAILILHALSGDAHAAGWHEGDDKPGWWDSMIGPGKAFDTDRYYIICSNVLGGCMGTTGPYRRTQSRLAICLGLALLWFGAASAWAEPVLRIPPPWLAELRKKSCTRSRGLRTGEYHKRMCASTRALPRTS
jgi:hypothetical protein